MGKFFGGFLYEQADYDLLDELNQIISGSHPKKHLQRLFDPYLHPRGIKEMAAPKEIRIVYAMLKLLDSLEQGNDAVTQRVNALKSLRDELMDGTPSSLRLNTARVLLQIVKLLIRSGGDRPRQLRLAHELRMALVGQPRFIRRQLRRYHLLEMPEEWNQVAFDDHVHDANTKGRKTPTHLIMDAWIKGIRRLQVIYYNYVPRHAADELLRAAEIMKIDVRIGVELPTVFRGKFVEMIWAPRGFTGCDGFMAFLDKEEVRTFSAACRLSSDWKRTLVLDQLRSFNAEGREKLNRECGVVCAPLDENDFIRAVGFGQPSLLHLSEFISAAYVRLLREREEGGGGGDAPAVAVEAVSPETIHDLYLSRDAVNRPPEDPVGLPGMMRLTQYELTERLNALPAGYRLTLNLSDLKLEDVIEIVYDCRGRVTHLEIFNLKDYMMGKSPDMVAINNFRLALNYGDVIRLKQIIRDVIAGLENSDGPDRAERVARLRVILRDLPCLIRNYAQNRLEARLGSDSTGRYRRLHGMGMVVIDSLLPGVRRRILNGTDRYRELIPVSARVSRCRRYLPYVSRLGWLNSLAKFFRRINSPFDLGYSPQEEWRLDDNAAAIGGPGNISTLGGYYDEPGQDATIDSSVMSLADRWNCLNSNLKILIKMMIGFVPAFLSFFLTKDWWLLAYFGAFIWLGITGVRNVIQAVLGGGGLRRSDLLKWNDFISWQRIADSLMYTGISVPLLDYVIKTLLMEKMFGLTAEGSPVLVYTAINLANGFYISAHNAFRGLPRTAVVGNFFRAGFAIPLSLLFNVILSVVLGALGVAGIAAILQQWAAVISKTASDCVAGVIEGYADRIKNINLRLRDYRFKLRQLFTAYAALEVRFPEDDVTELLKSPKNLIRSIASEEQSLERMMIINALDLLYFWMYQPQAHNAMRLTMLDLSADERIILLRSQNVLKREKEISQLFIDGLVGKNFAKALAFYLDYNLEYLDDMKKLTRSFDDGERESADGAATQPRG